MPHASLSEVLSVVPPSCAEQRRDIAHFVDAHGAIETYHGRVLVWTVAKSASIGLEFKSPWYAERTFQVFAWAVAPVTLRIYVGNSHEYLTLELKARHPGELCYGGLVRPVPLEVNEDAHLLRITIVAMATPDVERAIPAHVTFALDPTSNGSRTAAWNGYSLNDRTRFYGYTWINVLCALFALFAPLGSYGFLLIALPAIPALLKIAGIDTAVKLDIAALSFWLYTRIGRIRLPPLREARLSRAWWGLISIPLSAAATYVLIGLAVPYFYAHELSEASNAPPELGKDIELFCSYPERREARALLARRFSLIRSESEAWGAAVGRIREIVDTSAFLDDCLRRGRVGRWFSDVPSLREDEARAFYAALIFYAINDYPEFDSAMTEIRRILFLPNGKPAGPLSNLAWTTFSVRMVKNTGEYECRKGGNAQLCEELKRKCPKLGAELERVLNESTTWSYLERRYNAIYIEARDVAASTRLSPICSAGTAHDVKQAIAHYQAMLGAIPSEPWLDRPLHTINLRNFAEARLSAGRSRSTSVLQWAERCKGNFARYCAEIQEVIVGSGDRRFFSKDRGSSNAEWDKPSLTQATAREFWDIASEEAKRYWRKPWAYGSDF